MDLANIGRIDVDGGPLGPLELRIWDADFASWVRGQVRDAAPSGGQFTRALLSERVRRAGEDVPLGAEPISVLDDDAVETIAEAIFTAAGEMLRPRYVETGHGRRKRARRRRKDEPFPTAREPSESAAERLARVLIAVADDQRLSSRALLDAATGLHAGVASALDAHKTLAAFLPGGLAALTAPTGAMRSALDGLTSPTLTSALASITSPVHQEALALSKTVGSLGLADRSQGALGLSGHGATASGLLSGLGAIGRFNELSDRAAEVARSISEFSPGQGLTVQTAVSRITEGLNASLDPTRRAGAEIAERLSGYGAVLEATRMSRWSESVAGRSVAEMMQALRPHGPLFAEIERMRADARLITQGAGALAAFGAGGLVGQTGLVATSLKMSALAGARDVFGPQSAVERLANRALLGDWATRPDLPERFWNELSYRREVYREAHVDEGLIETPASGVLDVMVTSGLNGGLRDEACATALVPVGSLVMAIRADDIEGDARRIVSEIERAMRAFVAQKLEAVHGPDWVKQRTPGDIFKNAKRKREAALKDGEASRPLIDYIDIGELMEIVVWTKNWGSVFADVFIDAQMFALRVRSLNAVRRPSAHSRDIDGVQLVELSLQAYRLGAQMKDDGAWKIAAQSDV